MEATQGGVTAEADCDSEEIEAPTKSIDYGIFFGGGLDIQAGPGVLTLDVLYNLGLGDIADEDPIDPVVDISNKNIQILAGYGFKIGPQAAWVSDPITRPIRAGPGVA